MHLVRRSFVLAVCLLPVAASACTHEQWSLARWERPGSPVPNTQARPSQESRSIAAAPANAPRPDQPVAAAAEAGSDQLAPGRPTVEKVHQAGSRRRTRDDSIELLAGHLQNNSERASAPAAPPAPEENQTPGELTLARLEEIAMESNPSLQQLAAVVEKARGIHEQAGLYPNPVVGYTAGEVGNGGNAGQQGAYLSQTIITGDKLQLTRDVASWSIEEMNWQFQAQQHRVRNDVRLRFYEALGAYKRMQIAEDLLKVAQQGVSIAKELFKAKEASRADVLQATVDLNQIRIVRKNAQFNYEAAWKRLTTVIGRPDMEPGMLVGEITRATAGWEWNEAYQKLLADSPQLQVLRARVQGACLSIQRQEAQPIPNLLTQVAVQHDFGTGDAIASVQLGVPLPVFNRNQGNIRLAQAEYHRAVRDVERTELQLRDQLAVAHRNFKQAKYQVELYEKEILANAREGLKLTEETYKAGEVNFLRVLTARRTYFEANLRYIESLVALRQADVIISGFILTGGLTDVPDIGSRPFAGPGQRGQALSGQ